MNVLELKIQNARFRFRRVERESRLILFLIFEGDRRWISQQII